LREKKKSKKKSTPTFPSQRSCGISSYASPTSDSYFFICLRTSEVEEAAAYISLKKRYIVRSEGQGIKYIYIWVFDEKYLMGATPL
jgi:hypothetical protein